MFNKGTLSTISPHTQGTIFSGNIFASAPTLETTSSSSYVLVKQYTMNSRGKIFVGGTHARSATATTSGVDVRINDVSVVSATTAAIYPAASAYGGSLANVLSPGDTIKIYIRRNGGSGLVYMITSIIKIAQNISLYTSPTVNLD